MNYNCRSFLSQDSQDNNIGSSLNLFQSFNISLKHLDIAFSTGLLVAISARQTKQFLF